MKNGLIITLHGFGSNGNDLSRLGSYFVSQLQGIIYSSPNAPYPCEGKKASYQWFDINNITEENLPDRIKKARIEFDSLLKKIINKYHFNEKLDRIILIGFSQGSIMALDAIVSGRWHVAGVIAFSGRLALIKPFKPYKKTSILLVHGYDDSIISWHESQLAANLLKSMGIQTVETHFEKNTGHSISPQGARAAVSFLSKCFLIK